MLLAKLWKDACKSEAISGELIMGIDPVDCQKMVNDFYVPALGKTKEELLAACPQNPHQSGADIGQWNSEQKTEAEALVKGKCLSCHRQTKIYETDLPFIVMTGPESYTQETVKIRKKLAPIQLDKLDQMKTMQMIEAIKTQKMPKKEPLTDDQRKMILDYLQKRMLDMPASEYSFGDDYNFVRRYSDENLEKEYQKAILNNPNLPEEQSKQIRIYVNCLFGQKNCGEYLALAQKTIDDTIAISKPAEPEKYRENKMMEIRCQNLIEVTSQQCVDWAAANKK
jgi:hypothetical protein